MYRSISLYAHQGRKQRGKITEKKVLYVRVESDRMRNGAPPGAGVPVLYLRFSSIAVEALLSEEYRHDKKRKRHHDHKKAINNKIEKNATERGGISGRIYQKSDIRTSSLI